MNGEYLEVTWGRTFSIWWSFIWRASLAAALAGAVVGFIAGVLLALAGSPHAAGSVGAVLGFLVSVPASVFVLRGVLRKRFAEFAIRLVPNIAR
jgi:hypothetical protein